MGLTKKSAFSRETGVPERAASRFFIASAALFFLLGLSLPAFSQTELGSADDLTVLGANGTALDPDTEIKGFTVFGSTQAAYTGGVAGPGNVVVNGALAVSSGAYFTAVSTFSAGMYVMAAASFTNVANIYITGGADNQVLAKNGANGPLKWTNTSALGDNLGNHTATQQLNMGNYAIWSSSVVTALNYQIGGSTVLAAVSADKTSTGVGVDAGRSNTGSYNTYVGYRAGYTNTAAAENTYVGHRAGYNNTSGNGNAFLGNDAGYNNNTGSANTFLGDLAGTTNTAGASNNFIGYAAGYSNTTGSSNFFAGESAGRLNTTGGANVALGHYAGYNNTTGQANAYIGRGAGYYSRTGSGNIVVGDNAGGGNGSVVNSFSSSTIVGYQAGMNVTTGSNNIFLGWQAGDTVTTGANNIVIGYDKDISAPAASNELNIGNLLYGKLDANKLAGINTAQPAASLHIVSSAAAGGLLLRADQSGGGQVFRVYDYSDAGALEVGYSGLALSKVTLSGGPGNSGGAVILSNAAGAATVSLVSNGDSYLTGGNLGVGQASPGARLDVKAAGSTAADMAQIWRDGGGVIKSSMSATGVMMAVKFVGDGSGLSGVMTGGDNLGNHTATTQLKMGNYAIWSSSSVTAAQYQIAGSTVLAAAGVGNVFVGVNAGPINTGTFNTFVGESAGLVNTGGQFNSFFGQGAGYTNTGSGNTFVGANAGWYNTSAIEGSFFGTAAGQANTTGNGNTFVGYQAGAGNTVGEGNTLMGTRVDLSMTTGGRNTIIGHNAAYKNVNGSANAILGYETGGYSGGAGGSFSSSTLMGYQAGRGLTTGTGNLLLGYQSGYSITSGTGNVVIGYAQGVQLPTSSNQLNIGGVLFGDLAAKTIGISTRAPQAALDVVSTGTAANQMAQIWRDGGGVIKSSMSATGVMMAVKYIGDGSGLSGVMTGGDNLGNHTATAMLNLSSNPIVAVSSVGIIGDGLHIVTNFSSTGSGIFISTAGSIMTVGVGNGFASPNPRGKGAVDLQTFRLIATHVASGENSSVLGGMYNTASAEGAVVSGGSINSAVGNMSTVSGGQGNTASGLYTVVAGGYQNNADGTSAISGGYQNTAIGAYSAVTGGIRNTAKGNYSWAGGYRSSSTASGAFTWSDGEGSVVENAVTDRTVFKNRGGMMITALTGTLTGNLGMLDVVSTATNAGTMAQVWRDGGGVIKSSMSATGVMMAVKFVGDGSGLSGVMTGGDNLGNHTATQNLQMAGFQISNAGAITASSYTATGAGITAAQVRFAAGAIAISSETSAALGGGVRVSTNMYIVGFASATKFYGDGSGLTGVLTAGDNLGNHTATAALNMAQNAIVNVGSITMVGDGLRIGTNLTAAASGIYISTGGAIATMGQGNGTVTGNARGMGAVDLQTSRAAGAQVASGLYSIISGGQNNTASNNWTTVSGGYSNTASSFGGTVSGGANNTVSSTYATISGGYQNTATNSHSSVSGGQTNTASGAWATVSGGLTNLASSNYATVSGGYSNTASNQYATVSGGLSNTAVGEYSFAAGYASSSTASGAFTWADSAGTAVINNFADRTVFKDRGGFMITGNAGALPVNQGMLDVVSTGTAANIYAQVWRNNSGVVVASMTSQGMLYATLPAGAGADNLGNHTATQNLKLGANWLSNDGGASEGLQFDGSGNGYFSGNLGVGVAPGTNKFTIHGTDIALSIGDTNNAGAPPSGLQFLDTGNKHVGFRYDGNRLIYENASNTQVPSTWYGVVPADFIIRNGNVGISTGAPQGRLDILSAGSAAADMATIWRNSAGTIVSSMSATGVIMATKFVGDGTGLTGVMTAGDNLGNHTATQNLKLGANWLSNDGGASEGLQFGATGNANFSGNAVLGSSALNNIALTLRGPNTSNQTSAQDLRFSFVSAGSAGLRSYRGGSWDTYLQFLTNSSAQGSDLPQVRMHISGTGDVGISTGAPQARLDILAGGSAAADMATIWRNSAGTIVSSMSATGVLRAAQLQSVGDITMPYGNAVRSVNDAGNTTLALLYAGVSSDFVANNTILNSPNYLLFSINGSEKMRVDTAGNLGLNTGSAAIAAKMEVQAVSSLATDMAQIWRNSAGTIVSSMSATGVMKAVKFVGDGTGLTGVGSSAGSTNLLGGLANEVPYQTATNTTAFTGQPGANVVLFANNGAPGWTNAPTLTGTNITSIPGGNVTGSIAGGAGLLNYRDLRIIKPSDEAATTLRFGFTSYANNNSSPYADYLHLRSYSDASGGNDNLVMFLKTGIGMRIWQQAWGSATPYAAYKDMAFTDGTNATGTWPISITGTSAGAAPSGAAGGNLSGTYPNPSIASLPAISGAALTNLTAANISAGTAGINVTGNAATATKLNSQGIYAMVTPGTTRGPAGLNMFEAYTNGYPTSYGNVLHMTGAGSGQLLVGWSGVDGSHADNYIRSKRDNDTGAWSPWAKILTDINFNSYAPTLTGTGASGTWPISISGTSAGAAPSGAASGVLSGTYPGPGFANNASYPVAIGDGNGLKFWGGADTYKIAMGNAAEYHYGPVTDYSIKTFIDSNSNTRGFTWGQNGVAPVAALNVGNGNFQVAGTLKLGANGSVISGNASGVGIGNTTPDAALTVLGSFEQRDAGDAFRMYKNLASYNVSSPNSGGTVKIALPSGKVWSNTMLRVVIKGYDYSGNGAWEVIVGGYNYSTGWVNTSAEIRGAAPFSSVRLAHDGTSNVILLGTIANNLQYPKIRVDEILTGHSNITGWGSGWSISQIGSEAAITNIVAPVVVAYALTNGTNASGTWPISITGTSAGAAPSGAAGGNLGGTYPNPSIASLPAISGAALTSLTGANVTGAVPNATTAANLTNFSVASGVNLDTKGTTGIHYWTGGTYPAFMTVGDGALYQQAYQPAPTTWGGQIIQDYRTGRIGMRGLNNGTWTGWLTNLDSGNFNSYAPTLTGTGASGTWPISISGTSAGAAPSGAAGGMLSGTYPNPGLAANISVTGSVTGGSYLFPAPPGDPTPVITARAVPAGQGAAAEKTELILFHANDNVNGSGPDQITLRAPALSFQTYDNPAVADLNNNLGYNERMYITPAGNVGIGTTVPTAKLQVVGDTRIGNAAGAEGHLYLHGNGTANVFSTLMTTNGNLHLDAAAGAYTLYLNYFSGTGGISFGNGATGSNASVSAAGVFTGNGSGLTSLNPANISAGTANINITGSAGSVSGNSTGISVADIRGTAPTPNAIIGDKMVSSQFNDQWGGGWRSALTVSGWSDSYAVWQLMGGSNTSTEESWFLRSGVNSTWNSWREVIHSGNIGSQSVNYAATAGSAGGVAYANVSGIPTRTGWSGVHRNFVAEQLSWKNYGNGHTIFDASAGTSPDGGAVNNTNAAIAWSASYPTLMGWNGVSTYGIRVDSARVADSVGGSAGGALTGTYPSPGLNNNASYPVSAADGNGLKFWNGSDSYKISMGNAAENHYGSVTDYSIKTAIDSTAGRGFTWGNNGVAPTASLTNTGIFQAAGNVIAYGFQGNGNVGGTGSASWHPSGIYSAGTNWLYGQVIFSGAVSGFTSLSGGTISGTTLSTDGNRVNLMTHGTNEVIKLPAARNGGGTGDIGLYSWVSEPGQTWTGAGIARNMYNTTGFPRVTAGLGGQMINFNEGNQIVFTIEQSNGVRNTAAVMGTTVANSTFYGTASQAYYAP